ncbi:MAG: YgiT-type zinc finger protein [Ignavibacteriales bacterium]|nr:YgiT-type zinc finger protein [Ignavibacteriales bacterium]
MKCIQCQGSLRRGVAPFHADRKGYHLVMDSIPAWVCSQCGEVYFEDKAVDSIQKALRSIDNESSRLAKSA